MTRLRNQTKTLPRPPTPRTQVRSRSVPTTVTPPKCQISALPASTRFSPPPPHPPPCTSVHSYASGQRVMF